MSRIFAIIACAATLTRTGYATVTHHVDCDELGSPDCKDVTNLWPTQAVDIGAKEYIEGTRTWDTFRYATTKNFPLSLSFRDNKNIQHLITLTDNKDDYTFAIPVGSELYVFGDEKDRIGSDAMTQYGQLHFTYQDSSAFHSHGILSEFQGYKDDTLGFYAIDTDSWAKIVDIAAKATHAVVELLGAFQGFKAEGATDAEALVKTAAEAGLPPSPSWAKLNTTMVTMV